MIKSFVGGKDVFAILPTGYVMCCACLPILLDHLHEQQHAAIVIVVTPLPAIMEEQVRPSITIPKVKNSIIIQVASFSINTKQATRDAEKSMKEYEANTDTCRRDYYFIQRQDNNMSCHVHDKSQAITGCQCCDTDGYSTLICLLNNMQHQRLIPAI